MSEYQSTKTANQLLLVFITILILPVGVAVDKGLGKEFWISLILAIIFFIFGLIYPIYVLLK